MIHAQVSVQLSTGPRGNRSTGWVKQEAQLSPKDRAMRRVNCQLKSCQLPRNSAETTYRPTTSPNQIDGMELEI